MILLDSEGREIARSLTDFAGYALFDGLAFGAWQAQAAGQVSRKVEVSRDQPDGQTRSLLVPQA